MMQNKTKYIGLTGSIATGKSTVSSYLKKLGYPLVDADVIAKNIYSDKDVYKKTLNLFGRDILDGEVISRDKLARKVFGNKKALDELSKIVHPGILKNLQEEAYSYANADFVFLDIPLLLEMKKKIESVISFYEIWLVYVPREIQIERLIKRDGIDRAYALKKLNSQMSIEDKKRLADVILYNDTSLENLYAQVDCELKNLKERIEKNR